MPRRSLERRVEALIDEEANRKGFHHFEIDRRGGSDDARSGFYEWNADREMFVNAESGHTLPASAEPKSEFEYEISYNSGDS